MNKRFGMIYGKYMDNETGIEYDEKWESYKICGLLNELAEENKEFQERNQRQAKTIRQLYNLIENKDWETLTAHLEELKKAEEQLQREWRCYE